MKRDLGYFGESHKGYLMHYARIAMIALVVAALVGFADARPLHVLIVGGGTSHDFNRWWKEADSRILAESKEPAFAPVYTDRPAKAAREIADADVLLLATNQSGFSAPDVRAALAAHADAGKGIVLLHAGTWYNYKDWPEFNATYVGGGARGHDKIGEFEVTVTEPDHPLMKGLPAKFKVIDELYHMEPDPKAAAIEVLATATSPVTGKTFPSIWIVKHPKARIVAIALGHDGRVHDLDVYKSLLKNATEWVAEH
jgi:type 1 glutamine amidotransferase